MKKLSRSLILLPVLLFGSQWASATPVTKVCDQPSDDRLVTLDNISGGSATCGPSGITSNQNEGTYFSNNGYSFLSKLDEEDFTSGTGSDTYMSVSGLGGTSGNFEISDGLTKITAVFKFGSGNVDPDWISFDISNIATGGFSADWSVNQQQQLSHVSLYGEKVALRVTEPGTLALLGLGIVGLTLVRRRTRTN